jgi:3-deoxy-D-manno-octulosonic-acid transferase
LILYGFLIRLYWFAARIAAIRSKKARRFVSGRKNWQAQLRSNDWSGKVVWFHCASLGEFEQGRPLMEDLKKRSPQTKIILTFFSPSGYEVRKDYSGADVVCYLPMDTKGNATEFLQIVEPSLAIFVKYEVWANYFAACNRAEIPVYMVSAIFRPGHRYFKSLGGFFRRQLRRVSQFYVQNKESKELLATIGLTNVVLAGDTRFDRVKAVADQAKHIESVVKFKGNSLLVIAGSSWPSEERLISQFMIHADLDFKWIIAPHDVNKGRLESVKSRFPDAISFSEARLGDLEKAKILIIDNVGMLNRIYAQGDIAIIGGGFDKGLHNTLEAAVFGMPSIIGPNHLYFSEALDLRRVGGAFAIQDQDEFDVILSSLIQNEMMRTEASDSARKYVSENVGATQIIMRDVCSFLERVD